MSDTRLPIVGLRLENVLDRNSARLTDHQRRTLFDRFRGGKGIALGAGLRTHRDDLTLEWLPATGR